MNLYSFLTDPILRAPLLGSICICMTAALVGAIVFVRKRSLLGESLAHATYPGVTAAIVFAGLLAYENTSPLYVLTGACLSAILGFWLIVAMEKYGKASADSALATVLALFFGIGVVIASFAQQVYTRLYKQMQTYLYGQADTMLDEQVLIYSLLACLVVIFIVIFYRKIFVTCFDQQFAKTTGIGGRGTEAFLSVLIVLAIVMGIRCVGVILMSSMLIAPATAARQLTDRFSILLLLSSLFGGISAFLGLYLSLYFSTYSSAIASVPTGPVMILISSLFAIGSLLFAPKKGLLFRYIRRLTFQWSCIQDNLLKGLWRLHEEGKKEVTMGEIQEYIGLSRFSTYWLLHRLEKQQAIVKKGEKHSLTVEGKRRGGRIVRLHRLWEAYLVYSLGAKSERVHKSAEEIEHILTPELERQLLELLEYPQMDPHQQPIPEGY